MINANTKKPTTLKGWEEACLSLGKTLRELIDSENKLKEEIKDLERQLEVCDEEIDEQVEELEEQLTMSVGVIKYLEMKLEKANQLKISGGKG